MDNADTQTPLETLLLAVELCDHSQAEFARRIKRSTQVVWAWINRDKQASVEACPFIEAAVKDPRVTCELLRPDYKGWEILRDSPQHSESQAEV